MLSSSPRPPKPKSYDPRIYSVRLPNLPLSSKGARLNLQHSSTLNNQASTLQCSTCPMPMLVSATRLDLGNETNID